MATPHEPENELHSKHMYLRDNRSYQTHVFSDHRCLVHYELNPTIVRSLFLNFIAETSYDGYENPNYGFVLPSDMVTEIIDCIVPVPRRFCRSVGSVGISIGGTHSSVAFWEGTAITVLPQLRNTDFKNDVPEIIKSLLHKACEYFGFSISSVVVALSSKYDRRQVEDALRWSDICTVQKTMTDYSSIIHIFIDFLRTDSHALVVDVGATTMKLTAFTVSRCIDDDYRATYSVDGSVQCGLPSTDADGAFPVLFQGALTTLLGDLQKDVSYFESLIVSGGGTYMPSVTPTIRSHFPSNVVVYQTPFPEDGAVFGAAQQSDGLRMTNALCTLPDIVRQHSASSRERLRWALTRFQDDQVPQYEHYQRLMVQAVELDYTEDEVEDIIKEIDAIFSC